MFAADLLALGAVLLIFVGAVAVLDFAARLVGL